MEQKKRGGKRPGAGRPKVAERRRKTVRVAVYGTRREVSRWRSTAKREGFLLSYWIRASLAKEVYACGIAHKRGIAMARELKARRLMEADLAGQPPPTGVPVPD